MMTLRDFFFQKISTQSKTAATRPMVIKTMAAILIEDCLPGNYMLENNDL